VAGTNLLGEHYGVGGVLQLRGEGALSATAGGWEAGAVG
jgi:hypothetical protein